MIKKHELLVSVCALCVAIFATGVSVLSIYTNHKQKKIDNLVSLYQFLHQAELSDARSVVRNPNFKATELTKEVRRVCSSLDFAGTLVRNDAVDKDIFLDYWGDTLLILDKRLAPLWDKDVADGHSLKQFYKDFYWLIAEAKKRKTQRE